MDQFSVGSSLEYEQSGGEDEEFMNLPFKIDEKSKKEIIADCPEEAGIEEPRLEKLRSFNIKMMKEVEHFENAEVNSKRPEVGQSIDLNKPTGSSNSGLMSLGPIGEDIVPSQCGLLSKNDFPNQSTPTESSSSGFRNLRLVSQSEAVLRSDPFMENSPKLAGPEVSLHTRCMRKSDLSKNSEAVSANSAAPSGKSKICRSRSQGSSLFEELKIRKLGEELGIIFHPGFGREMSSSVTSPVLSC